MSKYARMDIADPFYKVIEDDVIIMRNLSAVALLHIDLIWILTNRSSRHFSLLVPQIPILVVHLDSH